MEMYSDVGCTEKLSYLSDGSPYNVGHLTPSGAFDGSNGMSRAYRDGCNVNTIPIGSTLLGWTFITPQKVNCVKVCMFTTDFTQVNN